MPGVWLALLRLALLLVSESLHPFQQPDWQLCARILKALT
jgi:hypothetical protein